MSAGEGSIKVGISQCLLGDRVRYDGGHKRNSYAVDDLGRVFSWVPVCPEVEAGMGVPREPVALHSSGGATRMTGNQTGTDHTDALNLASIRRLEDLEDSALRGCVLKSGSPSCGLEVEVAGSQSPEPGLFARALLEHFPSLPVIEETDLQDWAARQNFAERVFAYHRQMQFFGQTRSVGQLVMSHVQACLQLDAHQSGLHAEIGELFKQAGEMSYEELGSAYLSRFMQALQVPCTVNGHFAVLKRVFDEVKSGIAPPVLKELARTLQDYRQGSVPLGVPLTLLRHYIRLQEHPHFNQQTYLEPAAGELLLRVQL